MPWNYVTRWIELMRDSMGSMRDSSRSIDGAHTDAMGDDRDSGARGSHGGGTPWRCVTHQSIPLESGPTSEWERVGRVSGGRARRTGVRSVTRSIVSIDREVGLGRRIGW